MTTLIRAAQPIVGGEERAAVDAVLRSGGIAQGPEVAAFEQEFSSALVGGRECVAASSGTAAAHLGVLASGIGPGDEVIVPSFTFAATANVVAITGATPVFADIEPEHFCIDPAHVESLVTERTRAIMPVHLYGHPAAMPQLQAIADRHGLELYEDAAQAHGAAICEQPVGTFGRWAMFSLYPTKNMTSGEGGMVSCDADIARSIRLLRNQGMEQRYRNEVVGLNCRMTDIHAAIGRVQLGKLPGWTQRRQEIAARYNAELEGVVVPPTAPGATHVYHQYTIKVPQDRDGFAAALLHEHGVGSGVYYPTPVHRLPSYDLVLDLPTTEVVAAQVLSLPVHPALSDADVDRVVDAVNTVAKAGA
jgi:dTDP-4-amino-4,6-dideoxygalactose transaminase